ncbi:MAG: DUF2911 domain-containing protein [Saprospiraceae bacterium]|nr:DUF2911 domain-containing protein [Saprospiraceae bacterium]
MKILKWVLIVLGILAAVLFVAFKVLQTQTKKASPEQTVNFEQGDAKMEVFYNRPYKKGRDVFGDLLPYGKVWRTGANEPTTFTTSTDLTIDGKTLAAGKYTLWTIPNETSWTVIFNSKMYGWGVNFSGEASRDPAADALQLEVPVETLPQTVEQFTIAFEQGENVNMTMIWDDTRIVVPFSVQ